MADYSHATSKSKYGLVYNPHPSYTPQKHITLKYTVAFTVLEESASRMATFSRESTSMHVKPRSCEHMVAPYVGNSMQFRPSELEIVLDCYYSKIFLMVYYQLCACRSSSCYSSTYFELLLSSISFQCSRSCGGGTQMRDVMCLDQDGQVSKECHSKNKPYHYQRCSTTPCPTSAAQVKRQRHCRDSYSGNVCMYVIQANFCQFSHYRRMCCNSCERRH